MGPNRQKVEERRLASRAGIRRRLEEESAELQKSPIQLLTKGQLTVERSGNTLLVDIDGIKFEMGRGAGEELLASLTRALRPYAGFSVFDMLTQELDIIIDRMMAGNPAEDGRDEGRAEAFTRALALMRNSYQPDFDYEKQRAMARWNQRENGEAESEIRRVNSKREKMELDGRLSED